MFWPVHTEVLHRLGVQVYGILGSSPEKSRRAAEALGLEKGYSDYNKVLSAKVIQVVHITTPNRFHFEQASQAGKHVLCEKPLAMTTQESSALVDLATQCGMVAGVNYNIHYYPLNIEVHSRNSNWRTGYYQFYLWQLRPGLAPLPYPITTGVYWLRRAGFCVLSPTSAPIGSIWFRLLPVWKWRPFVPI